MKKFISFLIKCSIVILIVFLFLEGYSLYLNKRIEELYNNYTQFINHIHGNTEKDKGNILMDYSMNGNNILVMGSSELSSPVYV